ncbi:MAG: hypothetical protein LKK12_05455 [Bacteroidales bacterium]|jgi:hypothetical protein|nr:hypothetical protein [Bacteroidales bacterium]MCI2133812.1 hypothetical protein [Bacteroidales bacterium]
MRTNRNLILIFAGVLALALMSSCSKVKDIKITSVGLESLSPKGFRSADAVLAVGIDNPAMGFIITKVNGILKYNGEDFASYSADSLSVDKKCVKVYDLPCSAELSESVGLAQVMTLLKNRSLEGFTTDVEARVTLKNGVGKTFKFKDLDLNKLSNE